MESSARPATAVGRSKKRFSLAWCRFIFFFNPLRNIFSSTSQKRSNTHRNAVKARRIRQLPVIQKGKKAFFLLSSSCLRRAAHTSPWETVASFYSRLLCRNNLLIALGRGAAISNFLFKPIPVQLLMCAVMLMEVLAQCFIIEIMLAAASWMKQ